MRLVPKVPHGAALALAVALVPSYAVHAACPAGQSATACAAAATSLSLDPPVVTPDDPRAKAAPWSAEPGLAPPLAVSPGDTTVAVRTSSAQWREFENQLTARRIEELKAAGGKAVTLPKAPAILSSIAVKGEDQQVGRGTTASAGADYKLSNAATAGIAIEHDDTRSAAGQADRLKARLALKASDDLSLETRSEWDAAADGRTTKNTVAIAPKLAHPFQLDQSATTVTPFVTAKGEIIVGGNDPATGVGAAKPVQSAGAGITVSQPNRYSMSMSADVEAADPKDPPNLKSRFQLSVPLN